MTKERGILEVSAEPGTLAVNACRPLNHKTFKIRNSLTRTTGRKAKTVVQKSRSTVLQLSFPLSTVKY